MKVFWGLLIFACAALTLAPALLIENPNVAGGAMVGILLVALVFAIALSGEF